MTAFTVTPNVNNSDPKAIQDQAWAFFTEGVRHVFMRWTALKLAIDHSPYPRSSSDPVVDELLFHTVAFFKKHAGNIEPTELADNFDVYMGEQLGVDIEDGSPIQVGKMLLSLYRDVFVRGDVSGVLKLREENAARMGSGHHGWHVSSSSASGNHVVDETGDLSSDENDDDDSTGVVDGNGDSGMMDVDAGDADMQEQQQQRGPILDEDGFELVVRRNKRC